MRISLFICPKGKLNVFPEVQNALNANKMRFFKEKTALIAATKCWLPPVTKNL